MFPGHIQYQARHIVCTLPFVLPIAAHAIRMLRYSNNYDFVACWAPGKKSTNYPLLIELKYTTVGNISNIRQ